MTYEPDSGTPVLLDGVPFPGNDHTNWSAPRAELLLNEVLFVCE